MRNNVLKRDYANPIPEEQTFLQLGKIVKTLLLLTIVTALFISCNNRSSASRGGYITDFEGYPMNQTDQTISWFVSNGYLPNSAFSSAAQSPFHTGLAEQLGVRIDWRFPTAGTPGAQAFNLMMASPRLPDIIFHGLMRDSERYINEGTIWDLTDYIQEYSPAYWAWLQSNPAYDRAMKTDQGKYYGYGFFREDGGWNDTYLGPVIRKDWLDELGLPMPATIDDWDRTIRAFRDRYGAVLSFARSRVFDFGTGISGAFGAYTMLNFALYIDRNHRIQLANAQPEFRNYLAKLNEWWRAGLIDQDVLSIDDTMARTNALNGRMGISFTSMGQITLWENEARAAGNGAQWVGLQYPRGNDGTLVMVPGGYGIGNSNVAVISTSVSPEKLKLVMRALDYAYTDEGRLYWNFGKQGVSWDFNSNGEVEYLPLVTEDPNGLNNATDKYGGATWSGSCIQLTRLLHLRNSPTSIAANDTWFFPNQDVTAYHTLPPGMTLTVQESNRVDDLESAIRTYTTEMAANFLTGQASLDTWDAYIARLNQMGMQELISIYQAAYDRYRAR